MAETIYLARPTTPKRIIGETLYCVDCKTDKPCAEFHANVRNHCKKCRNHLEREKYKQQQQERIF